MRLLLILSLSVGCAWACTVVEGDRILGGDLARANPVYSALPADLIAGFAPMPGSERVIDARHLGILAHSHGISLEKIEPLCFERPTDLLTEPVLRAVLERVLGPETKLEILEFSRYPIPRGELEFSLPDLPRLGAGQTDGVVTWRGRVRTGLRSTAVVWARSEERRVGKECR